MQLVMHRQGLTLDVVGSKVKPRSMIVPIEAGRPIPDLSATALAAAMAIAITGTSVTGANAPVVRIQDVIQVAPVSIQTVAIAEMLRAIRRRTALTWDHLSSIFSVSRRSLHHWANGQTVTAENEFKVKSLFERMGAFGDEPVYAARAIVLAEYGLSTTSEIQRVKSLPISVADHTPIADKVSFGRSASIRVK